MNIRVIWNKRYANTAAKPVFAVNFIFIILIVYKLFTNKFSGPTPIFVGIGDAA